MSLILDDRNPNIIYSSGWAQGGSTAEYNGTTTYTSQAGATMTLSFQGISIAVYGTIGSSNSGQVSPETTYQLDENDPVTYVPTLLKSAQHYQQFYQSPQVSKGQHTLLVTNMINASDIYIVDYLVIQTGDATSSISPTPTPTGKNSASNSEHHRTGVITGSVFGAVGCILSLALIYFLIRRRKRRKSEWEEASTEVPSNWNPSISPFQGSLTTSQRPVSDPKALSTTNSPLPDHGSSSYAESPPAYTDAPSDTSFTQRDLPQAV